MDYAQRKTNIKEKGGGRSNCVSWREWWDGLFPNPSFPATNYHLLKRSIHAQVGRNTKRPYPFLRMRKFARSGIFFCFRQHPKTFGENIERKKVHFNLCTYFAFYVWSLYEKGFFILPYICTILLLMSTVLYIRHPLIPVCSILDFNIFCNTFSFHLSMSPSPLPLLSCYSLWWKIKNRNELLEKEKVN